MSNFARQFLKIFFCNAAFSKNITLKQTPHRTIKANAIEHLPRSLEADGFLGGAECIDNFSNPGVLLVTDFLCHFLNSFLNSKIPGMLWRPQYVQRKKCSFTAQLVKN
jgi:hypothetical protein